MPTDGGQSLGRAQGSIEIDLRDLENVRVRVRQVSAEVEREFKGMAAGAAHAQQSFGGLERVMQKLGAVAAGVLTMKTVQAGVELARTAAKADQLAQRFGFLANISGQSADAMLSALQRASRGHIANTDLMFAANRAMLLGVADTIDEMEALMRVAGARAGAMGMSLTQAFDDLVVGIGRLSPRILDNLGLILDANTVYTNYGATIGKTADQLNEAERRQAFYNAVIDQSRELVEQHTSAGVSAAGRFQQLETAADNARVALGRVFSQDVTEGATNITTWLDVITRKLDEIAEKSEGRVFSQLFNSPRNPLSLIFNADSESDRVRIESYERHVDRLTERLGRLREELQTIEESGAFSPREVEKYRHEVGLVIRSLEAELTETLTLLAALRPAGSSGTTPSAGAVLPGGNAPADPVTPGIRVDFAQEMQRISEEAARQRTEIERQHGLQRSQVVANYAKMMARDEEDYARQRARAAAQLAENIANLQQEAAAREVQWAQDLAEKLDDIRGQSGQRVADWQADHEERVAELRASGAKRLADIEEDYQRSRERAETGHRENLLSAAGNLDAAGIAREQRRYALEQAEAERAYQERVAQEQESTNERITQEQEAHQERLEREARNLAQRIAQEEAGHAKRLEAARIADAKRLADLQASFDAQRRREEEDRAIRLARQEEDHQQQLAQMDAAHAERLTQIDRQERANLKAWEDAHAKELAELGLFHQEWKKIQDTQQELALKKWDEWWEEFKKRFDPNDEDPGYADGGPVKSTGAALVHAGEYVLNPRTTAAMRSMLGNFDQNRLLGAVAGARSASLTLHSGAIQVVAGAGQSPADIGYAVRIELERMLEEMAR